MQRVKLHARGIVQSDLGEVADRSAQVVHARDDPELRDERESKHQADDYVTRRKDMRSTVYEAVVKQRTSEKYQPGDNGNPMKFAQSPADKVSSEMGVGQNLKRSWCQDERKENQSADPDDERKQHEV